MTLPKIASRDEWLAARKEHQDRSPTVSEGGMTTSRGHERRRRLREERSRRAVADALAREYGLRVEEPAVLGDLFSLMVHLRPAPVVARVATCIPKLWTPISGWAWR